MELKELTERTVELFGVKEPDALGGALMAACYDNNKLKLFCDLVGGDLTKDWLQMIYQYYLADRKDRKQDYTPASVARFMGRLAGDAAEVVDLCSGSGALIIQKWGQNPDAIYTAIEADESVIPFLLFNLVLRNIRCDVYLLDALTGEEPKCQWSVLKGDEFGCLAV